MTNVKVSPWVKIINTGFSEIYTKVNITRDQIDKAELREDLFDSKKPTNL